MLRDTTEDSGFFIVLMGKVTMCSSGTPVYVCVLGYP